MGRPKGSRNKNGYKLSPEAYIQRCHAPLKDGTHSKVWKEIIEMDDDSGEWSELFKQYKLEAWKKLGSPLMFIAEEVANMKAYFDMLMYNGKLNKETFLKYQKVLLEFVKEINKYTQVSADTMVNVMKTQISEDKEMDVPVVKLPEQ